MMKINDSKCFLSLFIILFITLASQKSYGQYLHVDRVTLYNGLGFSGTIVENEKPDYLILRTGEHGDMKILYKDIKRLLKKPNPDDKFYLKGGHQYFSAGLGYGAEYAGIGTRIQIRIGRKQGFAHFIGIGFVYENRPKKRVYEEGVYLYSVEQGTYESFSLSSGIKFYPYKYCFIGLGFQIGIDGFERVDGFFFIGIDYPIITNILINASVGSHTNHSQLSPTSSLMINMGVSYQLTTNPMN